MWQAAFLRLSPKEPTNLGLRLWYVMCIWLFFLDCKVVCLILYSLFFLLILINPQHYSYKMNANGPDSF